MDTVPWSLTLFHWRTAVIHWGIHSPVSGHLGCSPHSATTSSAVVDISVSDLLGQCWSIFLDCTSRSGISGPRVYKYVSISTSSFLIALKFFSFYQQGWKSSLQPCQHLGSSFFFFFFIFCLSESCEMASGCVNLHFPDHCWGPAHTYTPAPHLLF